MADHRATLQAVLDRAGRTLCDQAGFTLADTPSPLYQLLVLATLLAKPVQAGMAVDACAELRKAGGGTPAGMANLTWQQRVDALGRAHYRRFDESSATMLGEGADIVAQRWGGDLRTLAVESGRDAVTAAQLLQELPGIGPAGADIFLREAQRVWAWLQPYLDDRVLQGAEKVGLPHTRAHLAPLFADRDAAVLAAALVRLTLDDDLVAEVRDAR